MENVWKCQEDAPEYKIQKRGCNALTDSELIGIMLGGTPSAVEKARNLFSELGDLRWISRASLEELQCGGLSEQEAKILMASFEVSRRKYENYQHTTSFTNSKEISRYIIDMYGDMHHEVFGIICLNRKHAVLKNKIIFSGATSAVCVDPKMIFREAVNCLASSIILYHNHPSNVCHPSKSDDAITKKMVALGKMMEIPVLDHLIIGRSDHYSYGDNGRIKEFESLPE